MTYVETLLWNVMAERDLRAAVHAMTQQAFEAFYQQMNPALAAYIYRVSGDRQSVEDLTQECFYRYLRAPLTDGDSMHQRSYLYRIATNLIYDRWKKVRHENAYLAKSQGEPAVNPVHDIRTDVQRVFNQLEPRDRALLWHAYVEGYEHREIASILGISALSVRVLLFRAKKKMVAILRKEGFGQ